MPPSEAQQIVLGRFRLPEKNGLCAPECPADCFWRYGRECRRYRGYTILGKTKFTRHVNPEKCWWLFLSDIAQWQKGEGDDAVDV